MVTRLKAGGVRIAPAAGAETKKAGRPCCLQIGAPAGMHLHRHELVIVQPRTAHPGVIDGKAQRLDQVQRATGVGAQANDIARVGRNFWLDENDVKHGEGG